MEIFELIWIFIVVYFLYRLFFSPGKPPKEYEYDVPSEPSYDDSETSTETRDDILDEMRTIFGEESTTRTPKPAPKKSEPVAQRSEQGAAQSGESPRSKYASYTGTDFIDSKGGMSEADRALEGVTLESRALQDKRTAQGDAFQFLFDQNEIRKGIIVSQVLGKPKSRKRHNI